MKGEFGAGNTWSYKDGWRFGLSRGVGLGRDEDRSMQMSHTITARLSSCQDQARTQEKGKKCKEGHGVWMEL